MSEAKKTTTNVETKNTGLLNSPAHLLILIVIFIVLLISAVLLQENKTYEPTPLKVTNGNQANITMTTTKQSPQSDEVVEVSVWENSGSETVNAVQASLSYPIDKFDLVNIDNGESAFEVEAQNSGENGQITISRGHKGNLTGLQLVTVISLRAKASAGDARLSFNNNTYLVSSVSHKDILSYSDGVNFSIGN